MSFVQLNAHIIIIMLLLLIYSSCCNSIAVCSWLSDAVLVGSASLCSVRVRYKFAVLTVVSYCVGRI